MLATITPTSLEFKFSLNDVNIETRYNSPHQTKPNRENWDHSIGRNKERKKERKKMMMIGRKHN